MRQSIRALGWASKIVWIATTVFMVTSLYSPLKLILEGQIDIGSPQPSFSNGTMTVFIPFLVNNTGFYDISDLNVTTSATDCNSTLISTSTTSVENIPRGGNVNETHVISVSIDDIISKNLTYLLSNDAAIVLDVSVGLKIAHVIPLEVSTSVNMSWGAPFYNASVRIADFPEPYNSSHYSINAWSSFENHSPFDVNGTLRLEIFNEREEFVGVWSDQVSAPSGWEYSEKVTIYVKPFQFSGTGEVHAYFEGTLGSVEWWFTYGR
ncbi:MAG: hypothetical protein OEZ29_06105 [Candidatus Bathyarchaeota archaeon]|nr:hypothetical protein [Candidatus Bathyarchaeota archaeon]